MFSDDPEDNINFRSDFHVAILTGKWEPFIVDYLKVDEDDSEFRHINNITCTGDTLLNLSAEAGNPNAVRYLISKGADTNVTNDTDGRKAIHVAAQFGHTNIVCYLLLLTKEIDVYDCNGNTPLYLAAKHDQFEVAAYLLYLGAKVNVTTKDKCTPLRAAICNGLPRIVHLLIFFKADIGNTDVYKKTPLYHATEIQWNGNETNGISFNSCRDILMLLLKAGADCNAEDIFGYSPFNILTTYWQNPLVFKLFARSNAYLKMYDYQQIVSNPDLIDLFTDVGFCVRVIMNKFNVHDLPAVYAIPFFSTYLPHMETMRIAQDSHAYLGLKQAVEFEIEKKGSCNVMEIRPIVLSMLCLKRVMDICLPRETGPAFGEIPRPNIAANISAACYCSRSVRRGWKTD